MRAYRKDIYDKAESADFYDNMQYRFDNNIDFDEDDNFESPLYILAFMSIFAFAIYLVVV